MDYSRQYGLFDPEKFNLPVHVIGCGATGSWVTMLLAKIGVKEIHVHDFDRVEEHNLPNQLFNLADVGEMKVLAADSMVSACTDRSGLVTHEQRVNGDTPLQGVVFVLTDTMASRSDIFNRALRNNIHVPLMVETRMGGEGGRVYALNPCDRQQVLGYRSTLYSDDDAVVSECGVSQSLAPTAAVLAGIAVWQLINLHNGTEIDNEVIVDLQNNTYLSHKF